MPKSVRGLLKIRRTCRKKVHERISAVSAMINALEKPESDQNYKYDLIKASEKLAKVLNEADIRLLIESMVQKMVLTWLRRMCEENSNQAVGEKSVKMRKRNELNVNFKRRSCKMRRHHTEAVKKQQELKRSSCREEEAELKNNLLYKSKLQSWAALAEQEQFNFLNDQSSTKQQLLIHPLTRVKRCLNQLLYQWTLFFHQKMGLIVRKFASHIWHLGVILIVLTESSIGDTSPKPKTELVKEIKLTGNRGLARDDELSIEKIVDGWEETTAEDRLFDTNAYSCPSDAQKCNQSKQLLQFDKSHRPAFYGIWPKKSQIVGPRCPFKKDPDLDYDIDSDEEWEECRGRMFKGDDESDDFMVPDGYLSENEGVQVDKMETDPTVEEARSSPGCRTEFESEEFCNQPLIILNLMHEKIPLLMAEDLSGTPKLEQMCLQALSMCAFPGGPLIEISVTNDLQDEDKEACLSNSRSSTTPVSTGMAIVDSDLPKIVSTIQACTQGINKLVESLQLKFPAIPKSQLRNKVREISDFVDNRWQVKKDVLHKLGLSISPEKGGRTKSIAAFFSKRCLPPSNRISSPSKTSPQQTQKPAPPVQAQQDCICIDP
ncbi:hypothetical protein AAG906_010256 [Vitis piasezkii]